MAVVRAYHGERLFPVYGLCETSDRFVVCLSKGNTVTFAEIDVGEVDDLTLYRSLVVVAESALTANKMYLALVELARGRPFAWQWPNPANAQGDLGAAVFDRASLVLGEEAEGARIVPGSATLFSIEHTASVAVIDDADYLSVLRDSATDDDYVGMMMDYAEIVIGWMYRVTSLVRIAYDNPEVVAGMLRDIGVEVAPNEVRKVIDTLEDMYRRGVFDTSLLGLLQRTRLLTYAVIAYYVGRRIGEDDWTDLVGNDAVWMLSDILGHPDASYTESLVWRAHRRMVDKLLSIGVASDKYGLEEITAIVALDKRSGEELVLGCDVWRAYRDLLPEREWSVLSRRCS